MAKLTTAQANERMRKTALEKFAEILRAEGEDVLVIASNAIAWPIVNENGEEAFLKLVCSCPKGTKTDPFDGYTEAEIYAEKLTDKAEKAKKAEANKAAKIERDRKERELRQKIREQKKAAGEKIYTTDG